MSNNWEYNPVYIFEDDIFQLRDDIASDVVVEEGVPRYSLFYKPNYHRVIVFQGDSEFALKRLKENYDEYKAEAEAF